MLGSGLFLKIIYELVSILFNAEAVTFSPSKNIKVETKPKRVNEKNERKRVKNN